MPRACKQGKVPINSETGVQREKALILSGREIPPGNWFVPPGSKRSSGGVNEAAEAVGGEGRIGDSASLQAKGIRRNTGSPNGDCGADQLATREKAAGLTGMAERLVVLTKRGNAGGGKGPQLKAEVRSDDRKGDGRGA